MKSLFPSIFAAVLIASVMSGWTAALAGQGGGVGRVLVSSIPPTSDDWIFVLEILIRGADRATEMAADATVCVRGDAEVVAVIHQLYHTPGLELARSRLARPIAGLQKADAARRAAEIMMDPSYPPNHDLSVGAARSAMRTMGAEGVVALAVGKLSQWGELPNAEDIDSWSGMRIAELLSENDNLDTVPALLAILKGTGGPSNSGARLGAACALLRLGRHVDDSELMGIIDNETNATVKDCLIAVGRGAGAGGGGETGGD